MAVEKCPGKDVTLDWRWWLSAHAGTHGFVVALLTGIPLLGVAEMVVHSLIDFGKCRLGYKLIVDQGDALGLQGHLGGLRTGDPLTQR